MKEFLFTPGFENEITGSQVGRFDEAWKLETKRLPKDLIDLINIYKCNLRIKATYKKRREEILLSRANNVYKNINKIAWKYKYHAYFLVRRIMELIGIRIEESAEKLKSSIVKIAASFGDIVQEPYYIDEFQVILGFNFQNRDQLLKKINLFLEQNYPNFNATSYHDNICISHSPL